MSNEAGRSHHLRPGSAAAQVAAKSQPKAQTPAAAAPQKPVTPQKPLTGEQRQIMICEAAYYLAEHRGFEGGHELDDWLIAEREIDAVIAGGKRPAAAHS